MDRWTPRAPVAAPEVRDQDKCPRFAQQCIDDERAKLQARIIALAAYLQKGF